MLVRGETLTYWSPGTENQFGGKEYGTPSEIKGRWEDKMMNAVDDNGQNVVSRAQITTNTDIKPMGFLLRGQSSETDPRQVDAAQEIRIVGSTPDLRNLSRIYTAYI